jgi:hypothetical protein
MMEGSVDGEGSEEGDDSFWLSYLGLLLQGTPSTAPGAPSRFGPLNGDAAKMKQFSDDMRSAAHQAIANMGKGCKSALGKLWNLTNGNSSLLGKTDPSNPNADIFFDGRDPNVANTPMTTWGYNSSMSTGQDLTEIDTGGFTAQYQGKAGNQIVLSPAFFAAGNPAAQNQVLLHEVLHSYTSLNDVDLASKLGIGSFVRDVDASKAISVYLVNDCSMDIYRQFYPPGGD